MWKPGTGLARALEKLGLTEDRYGELKEAIGLPPDCNCKARKEWMDKAWEYAVNQGYTLLRPRRIRQARCGTNRPPRKLITDPDYGG